MGSPVTYFEKFLFQVEIDGVAVAAYETCSDIGSKGGVIKYREGGRLHPHKVPGLIDYDPVTLVRSDRKGDDDLRNWWKNCYDAAAGVGQVPGDLMRTVDIVQLNRAGDEEARFTLFEAFPSEYHEGDFDNNAEDLRKITLVLEFDRFEKSAA